MGVDRTERGAIFESGPDSGGKSFGGGLESVWEWDGVDVKFPKLSIKL